MIFNFVVQKGRSWGNIVYTLLYNVPSSPQLNLWPARIGAFGKVRIECTWSTMYIHSKTKQRKGCQ